MQTVTYELTGHSLRVTGRSVLGKRYEFAFDTAQLDPEPNRVWERNGAVQQVWSIGLLLIASGPLLYLGLMGDKVVEIQPIRYFWVWASAIAACVIGWALAPRVESVVFRFKSGQPAVAVARSGSTSGNFDSFVAALSAAARGGFGG